MAKFLLLYRSVGATYYVIYHLPAVFQPATSSEGIYGCLCRFSVRHVVRGIRKASLKARLAIVQVLHLILQTILDLCACILNFLDAQYCAEYQVQMHMPAATV